MKTSWLVKGLLCACLLGTALPVFSDSTRTNMTLFEGGTVDIFQGKTGLTLGFSAYNGLTVKLVNEEDNIVYTAPLSSGTTIHHVSTSQLANGNYQLVIEDGQCTTTFNIIL